MTLQFAKAFFSNDPSLGERHIRIALTRDEVAFRETVDQLKAWFDAIIRADDSRKPRRLP